MSLKKYLTILFLSSLTLVSGCNPFHRSSGSVGIVIVGMGNSAKYGKCLGADVDAETMREILKKYGNPTVLTNSSATKQNVVAALNKASQSDLMIFYYSGHGGSDRIGDVKDEYLCLYNTYMLDNDIWKVVEGAKGRVVLIFDCCHSETMFRDPGVDFSEIKDKIERSRADVRMICWSGCPDDSYSYGGADGGVLTNAIRDSYKRGRTYAEVWKYASRKAASQSPRKTVLGKSFEKNLIFQ